jgi:hypothetical protein
VGVGAGGWVIDGELTTQAGRFRIEKATTAAKTTHNKAFIETPDDV